jgi:hypothetical protein
MMRFLLITGDQILPDMRNGDRHSGKPAQMMKKGDRSIP